MSGPAYCWYHDDQTTFKSFFSTMRKILHIHRDVSKACAMSVCTCRKGDLSHRTPMSQLEMHEYQGEFVANLQDAVDNLESANGMGGSTRQLIKDLLVDKNRGVESAARLVYVFKMALNEDYSLLEEELNQRKSKLSLKYKIPKEKKTVNQTTAIRCIIAKRKRQIKSKFSHALTLFSGRNIFRFDPCIKPLLNDVSLQFKPCLIELNVKKALENPNCFTSVLPITIWCEKKRLNAVIDTLKSKVHTPTFGRLSYKYPHYPSHYREYHYHDNDETRLANDLLHDAKKTKSLDFVKKAHHYNSHTKRLRTEPEVKKNSVKCYNCQQPQDTLPSSATAATNKNETETFIESEAEPESENESEPDTRNETILPSSATAATNKSNADASRSESESENESEPDTGNESILASRSTTVKNKHNTGTSHSHTECRYHPGFVANGKWSCCQQDSNQYLSPFSEHSTHGCAHSEDHKWLYQNKSKGSSNQYKQVRDTPQMHRKETSFSQWDDRAVPWEWDEELYDDDLQYSEPWHDTFDELMDCVSVIVWSY